MDIDVKIEGNCAIVTIDGNIDVDGGNKLTASFYELMENDDIKHVKFDLLTVKSITSSAIGKILKFYKHLELKKGKMEVVDISNELHTQFKEIHLNRIIPINCN